MRAINLPDSVRAALEHGAALAVSISGGKDSHALLAATVKAHAEHQWPGRIYAVHADLGRMEWSNTAAFVEKLAEQYGVELVVVQRTGGDLYARFLERAAAVSGTGTPWAPSATNRYCTSHLKAGPIDQQLRTETVTWNLPEPAAVKPWAPSSANRYCTSDLKRGPIDTDLRGAQLVVCAMGLRADESSARAKKPVVAIRKGITTKRLAALTPGKGATAEQHAAAAQEAWDTWGGEGRLALDWNPLLDWSEADVWEAIGTSREWMELCRAVWMQGSEAEALEAWPAHPAYVMGTFHGGRWRFNSRLSCAMCVLAGEDDRINGANHNPEAARLLMELEDATGSTYVQGQSIRELLGEG